MSKTGELHTIYWDSESDPVDRVLVHTLCRRYPDGDLIAQVLGVDDVPHLPMIEPTRETDRET